MYYMRLPKFDNAKTKVQNILRYNEYEDIIMNSFISLTKLDVGDNAPYPVWCRLIACGELGICEDGTIGDIVRSGDLDINGEMSNIEYVLGLDGKEHKGRCVPLYMLPSKSPFTTFTRFAEQLSQVDISQKLFVKGTRYSNIIVCDTEEEKKVLDEVFKNIESGELKTVVRNSLGWTKMSENDKKILQITDPQKFQAMEYLSSYHSELCRRIYGLFGFSMQGKDKQAQVNSDELEDREQPSLIYPRLIIDTVNDCLQKANEEFGFNWSIKPNKILARMLEDIEEKKEEKKEEKEVNVESEVDNNEDSKKN